MTAEQDAYEAVKAAIEGHPNLRGFAADDTVQPPGVVVYPPTLTFVNDCATDLDFEVYLVVKATETKPWKTLLGMVEDVRDALEETKAVVTTATPGTFAGSGTVGNLPAYLIELTYPL